MKSFQELLALSSLVLLSCYCQQAQAADLCAGVICIAPRPCVVSRGCDPATGRCIFASLASGSACSDGNACTLGDTCQAGVCVPGVPKPCLNFNPCARTTCNRTTGACMATFLPPTTLCNDGRRCTTRDHCDGLGHCIGTPKVCSTPPATQCAVPACNELTGNCTLVNLRDGTTCDDGSRCTVNDACVSGVCKGTRKCHPIRTPGGCTYQGCDGDTGACIQFPLPKETPCNDAKNCTTSDKCDGLGHCIGTPVVCSSPPPTQCTTPKCNEPTGTCVAVNLASGTPCNDGNACTTGDKCTNGVCAGAPLPPDRC